MKPARKPLIDWERRLRTYEDESARFFRDIDTSIERCDAVLASIKRTRDNVTESLLALPR